MKKLLSLIGITTLSLNSSVGIILIRNTMQSDSNKTKIMINDEAKASGRGEDNIIKTDNDIDIIKKLIDIASKQYDSPIDIIDQILPLLNNKMLSNDFIIKIIDNVLRGLKDKSPDIVKNLSYLKYIQGVSVVTNELAIDWDQQSDHGSNPLDAMKNFINTSKGDIAQAKTAGNKGQWHYVAVRAGNWNWNDFYQYIAGANMNYMIKVLSGGNYIGNLVDKYLHLGPIHWGFDKDAFLNEFSTIIQKIETNKAAWPYLIRTIVPLLKIKILKQENPTLGFKNLVWEPTDNHDLSLKTLLTELKHLLSPEGHKDLVNMFAGLLSGPFGEDIIVNFGMLGYYTFTELIEVANSWGVKWIVGDGLKPEVLAEGIVSQLTKMTDNLNITNILDDVITKAEAGITENPVVDLPDLASDLNKLYANDNFQTGLDQLLDIIANPETSTYSLEEIFKMWGVQKGEEDFKVDSPLAIVKKWIDDPQSILNQILSIVRNLAKDKLLV